MVLQPEGVSGASNSFDALLMKRASFHTFDPIVMYAVRGKDEEVDKIWRQRAVNSVQGDCYLLVSGVRVEQ